MTTNIPVVAALLRVYSQMNQRIDQKILHYSFYFLTGKRTASGSPSTKIVKWTSWSMENGPWGRQV